MILLPRWQLRGPDVLVEAVFQMIDVSSKFVALVDNAFIGYLKLRDFPKSKAATGPLSTRLDRYQPTWAFFPLNRF